MEVADVCASSPQLDGRRVRVRGRLVATRELCRLVADDGEAGLVLEPRHLAQQVLEQLAPQVGRELVLDEPAEVDGVVHRVLDGSVRLRLVTRIAVRRGASCQVASLEDGTRVRDRVGRGRASSAARGSPGTE
ncbi:MAG: hypothetical protein ACFCVF_14495 [Kineosporiaceae bacterium]